MNPDKGIYLVGGCVRDKLLGKEPKDIDHVVVGYTVPEFLLSHPTATPIGKSFPVFMVREGDQTMEYAFARRERKTGPGHSGFEVVADPDVTLEEDLSRRDLSINAMAEGLNGLIDPFGGRADLEKKVLRHIGPAFAEDPLRVYRLARFAAQLGFSIAPETAALARTMTKELYTLSSDRVGEESRKAMRSNHPRIYFDSLLDMMALGVWHHELLALVGVPAGPWSHHQELDSYVHTMMVLDNFNFLKQEETDHDLEIIRWAALTHDLGKAVTPKEKLPSHPGHDEAGVPLVEKFCSRLRLPKYLKDSCVLACAEHMRVHVFLEMKKGKWVDLVRAAEKTKLGTRGLCAVCMADTFGRIGDHKDISGPRALSAIVEVVQEETGHPIPESLVGEHIGLHIRHKKAVAAKKKLKELGYK